MEKIKYYVISLFIWTFLFIPTCFALTPEEIIEKEAPNGVISFNSVRPNNTDEAEFMVISDWYYRDSANSYGQYSVTFEWKQLGQNEDGIYEYSVDEGTIYVTDSNINDINNVVAKKDVKVQYKTGNEKILKEVNKSLKAFDTIDFTESHYLKTSYRINDLALVNYYYYNEKEDDSAKKIGGIVTYAPQFIKDTEGNDFTYSIDCRAGDGSILDIWQACFGGMIVYYDDMVYGYHGIGEVEEHTIFVDNSIEDTAEATVEYIQNRVKKYLGIDVKVEYQGTIDDLKDRVYDEAIKIYNENLQQGVTLGEPDEEANEYALIYVNNIFNDNVRKESDTDGRYYKMNLNGYDMYFLVVRTDISKAEVPKYLGKNALTDVEIKTNSANIPLDTTVSVDEITKGEEYNRIKNALGVNMIFKTFDIKLFSNNKNSYITKINDDEFEVKMPIPEGFKNKNLKVYYVDSNNNIEEHKVEIIGDFLVFKTNHFSSYSISYEEGIPTEEEPIKENITNPQTGDKIYYWSLLLLLSTGGIFLATRKNNI